MQTGRLTSYTQTSPLTKKSKTMTILTRLISPTAVELDLILGGGSPEDEEFDLIIFRLQDLIFSDEFEDL